MLSLTPVTSAPHILIRVVLRNKIVPDSRQINHTTCDQYPRGMKISKVHLENFTGYAKRIYGNDVANLREDINDGTNTSCAGVDNHETKLLLPQSMRSLCRAHETVSLEVQCIQLIKACGHCWLERIHYALS
ncbi:hypothetical protein LX32DRAFT_67695 [Colletotrichum zoysiae]|uniref:Uncharacterized protein n=1 Tax=Colletotrichum zoysiae TaxID=1216348 RepID=A0AAD9HBR7_9PEZI|nr:hypothetical protein LX32DRAFT_67695 [Colletotrichum zoysiae]